jgi:hypothetical protein
MLRERHRFGRGKSKLCRRVLLQRARCKRRGRVGFYYRLFDFGNDELTPFKTGKYFRRFFRGRGLIFTRPLLFKKRFEWRVFFRFVAKLRR